jgi:CBS domain-containing protein
MTEKVRTCAAGDDIVAALAGMDDARVRRLPVTDAGGYLVGIISIDDIVLRAVDVAGGVSREAFIEAMKHLCSRPAREPEINFTDTFVSG